MDKFIETDEKKQHLQQMISALNLEAEKCGSRLHEKKELIHEIEVRLAASEAGIAGKQDTIDNAFFESCRDRSASELSGALNKLETDIKRISAEYQRLEILKKGAGRVYENRLTEHSLLSISRDELYERREDQQKVLDLKIADSGYSGIDEISEILDLNIDPVLERSEIELFDRETDRLKIETARLELKLDGREYDEEKHRKAESENTGLKQRLTECAAASGEVRSLIADMTKRLNRKEELKIELDRLRIRGENINTLRNLFKGKKFIDYVATVYLRELCVAANSRFRKLTRESMRLELDEANNFIVRDYLNEGKIRSIKTLSGGQTFQAAFSLSLALADSIGKERSGFFFLDEGFGSLDRESLALVFESLKSLKKEDRTVGIISHVEELKQEIDTYITVCKDTEAGSLVTGSWDN
jgi:exonuclease SbcC